MRIYDISKLLSLSLGLQICHGSVFIALLEDMAVTHIYHSKSFVLNAPTASFFVAVVRTIS